MSNNSIQVDAQVIEQLTVVADTMAGLLEQVSRRHDTQSKGMDYFREDLGIIRDSIHHIAKVLHEGNGEKPLISRVAVIEEKVDNLEDQILNIKQQKNIEKKGKYAIAAAVVSATAVLGIELFRLFSG